MTDTGLHAARRDADLDVITDPAAAPLDVLVVGLGVTGAGVALDAASRGLRVAAIDAYDLAWGTSRFSSKLVHGGLRYLARFDLAVAYESAMERAILMRRTAPHLIRPLPLVLPERQLATTLGFAAGDVLRRVARTSAATLPRPRRLSATEVRGYVPALAPGRSGGGLLTWEGQLVDDARLVIGLARTAAGFGARIVTRCRAAVLGGDGAEVVDTRTGRRHAIAARTVINATGVWAGDLVPGIALRPSRGSHLVVGAEVLGGSTAGLLVPVPGEPNRYVFLLPQLDGTVYIGLTDEPLDGPVPPVAEAPESDVEFLLGVVNTVLAEPLRRDQVLGTYAALRPLLARGARSARLRSADLSRRHAVLAAPNGVITVVGGKLTTYRRMAQDAVDLAVRRGGLAAGRCRTRALPLVGAAPPARLAAVPAPRRLVARYGTEAPAVGEMGELAFGVRMEGALTVDDLLDRRLRVGLVPATRAAAEPAARAALADAGLASQPT